MNKEDIINKIKEIGTCENEDERLSKLTDLTTDVENVFNEVDTLNTNITNLNEDLKKVNEDLSIAQKANNKLFLQVTEQKSGCETPMTPQGEDKPKRKYEDLFKKI